MTGGTSYRSIATVGEQAALWTAGIFVTLAFCGFLPGLTTNIESLSLSSPVHDAHLFGIFEVSILHNLVHLALGAVALVSSGTDRHARAFLLSASVALTLLVIYGQLATNPLLKDLVPVSPADAWLHGVLAWGMFTVAVTAPGKPD